MANDRTDRGSRERSRIDVREDDEIRYWSHRLGVPKSQLDEGVREVGCLAVAVEAERCWKTLAGGGP